MLFGQVTPVPVLVHDQPVGNLSLYAGPWGIVPIESVDVTVMVIVWAFVPVVGSVLGDTVIAEEMSVAARADSAKPKIESVTNAVEIIAWMNFFSMVIRYEIT